MNEQILNLCNFIIDYQKMYDKDFKCIPIDNHKLITIDIKNKIFQFKFSNEQIQLNCISKLPIKYLHNLKYIVNQENTGYTLYF